MDIFGSTQTLSLGGKKYRLVILDDYSRYTWVFILARKSETFEYFSKFAKMVQNEKGYTISSIKSNHGREFENQNFAYFCDENGIQHTFSSSYTLEQNGVVERKNRTLQKIARTLLFENKTPTHSWVEAISTACYILNRIFLRQILEKNPL